MCPNPPHRPRLTLPGRGAQSPHCGRRRKGQPRHRSPPLPGAARYSLLQPLRSGWTLSARGRRAGRGRSSSGLRGRARRGAAAPAANVTAAKAGGRAAAPTSRERGALAARAPSSRPRPPGEGPRPPAPPPREPRHSPPPPPPPSSSMLGPQAGRSATAEGGPELAPLARRLAAASPRPPRRPRSPPRSSAPSLSAPLRLSPGGGCRPCPAARPSHVTREGADGEGRPGRPCVATPAATGSPAAAVLPPPLRRRQRPGRAPGRSGPGGESPLPASPFLRSPSPAGFARRGLAALRPLNRHPRGLSGAVRAGGGGHDGKGARGRRSGSGRSPGLGAPAGSSPRAMAGGPEGTRRVSSVSCHSGLSLGVCGSQRTSAGPLVPLKESKDGERAGGGRKARAELA